MKKIIVVAVSLFSLSAFAQAELKCAKAIATLASSAHSLGVYKEKVRSAELEAEGTDNPELAQAKISALSGVYNAKKAVFNMSANLISVSCMNANMLQSGPSITSEIKARFESEENSGEDIRD